MKGGEPAEVLLITGRQRDRREELHRKFLVEISS